MHLSHLRRSLAFLVISVFATASIAQITIGIDPGGGITIPLPGGGSDGGGIGVPVGSIPGGGDVIVIGPGGDGDGSFLPIGPGGITEPTILAPRGALVGATVTATVFIPGQSTLPGASAGSATYQWSIQGAQGTSSARSSTFEFVAERTGTVTLFCNVAANGTSYHLTAEITMVSAATVGKMTAPASVVANAASASASVPPAQGADRTFRWSISGDGTIASGQGTPTVTFLPGSPGVKELTCAVNLQNLVSVPLRSFIVVTGDGPPVVVTINNGSGGGTHPGGSRVDIFADPPAAGQVFDRWSGDTSVLATGDVSAIATPHAAITVPSRPIELTATYKSAPIWSATTVADFGGTGVALSYFIPTGAHGLVFLLHDVKADAGSWFNRPEHALLLRDFVAAGYGIAALSSSDRSANATWSMATALDANADLRNHAAALQKFARENAFPADGPLFFLGVGAGGSAAAQFAQHFASVPPVRSVKGAILFCAVGSETLAVTSSVPHFFALAANDEVTGVLGNNEARNNAQLLTGRGIVSEIFVTARAPVHPARFRALAATVPAFTAADAQAIWSALKTADLLDANHYVRATPELDDIQAALPVTHRARAAEVAAQLAIANGNHELTSEAGSRVIAFLDARVAGTPGPAPGRIINLSTRTRIAFVGDTLQLGFNLSGSQRTTLLIRGIGPALAAFGVDTPLVAPRIDVHRGPTLIATNEGWEQGSDGAAINAAAASVGAFALKKGELDAATLLTLDPGTYTVTLQGVNGASGDVLVEVYDVSRNGTRLTNLSTLGKIHRDGDLLVPGITIDGTHPRTFVARAVGPGLGDVGFAADSVLGDPRLSVLNSSGGIVKANQNWSLGSGAALAAAFPAMGAFPLKPNSPDAALVSTLAPGSYTLQVGSGALVIVGGQPAVSASDTGAVLVEIYEVP